MALTVNIPAQSITTGTIVNFPPRPIPGFVDRALLTLDVSLHVDPQVEVIWSAEMSQDNGATWQPAGGATWIGDPEPRVNRDGVPITTSSVEWTFPGRGNRRWRAQIEVRGPGGKSFQTTGGTLMVS